MRFFRHLGRLLKEFFEFAWHHKVWWIIPLLFILLLVALVLLTVTNVITVSPFIYTLW